MGHFFGPTSLGQKIVNTSRMLALLVWMDAEFILVSIDTKNSMKQQELVGKSQFFQRVLKMGNFGQTKLQRGDPLQNSRNWPFFWPNFVKLENR